MARRRTKIVKVAGARPAVMRPGERVTLVRSDNPKIVAKQFRVEGGRLVKESVANIISGLAWSKAADNAESFAAILHECSSRTNVCLIPGRFTGDDIDGKPFRIVDEATLARTLKKRPGDGALAGIHDIRGTRVAARLKRSITHAAWVLLDADDAPGMPEEMRAVDLHQRLEAFEKLIPGIAKAERILSRSSSFRVRRSDEPSRRHGHAWLRVSDPSKIEVMRTHLKVVAVNEGLAFPSPRHARKDDPERCIKAGDVIGHEMRTLFDLSVLVPGRLVFIAQPILGGSATEAGYVLDDPGIVIENAGHGALDISAIELPTPEALAEHNRITGTRTTISSSGAAVGIHVRGELKADTPIERRGVERPLSEWLADLKPGAKLRCEAPFRASASEAAFIRKHDDGSAIVHDVGVGTTWSWPGPDRHEEGEPGERVVIGVDRLAMIEAAMQLGIDWLIRLPDLERLAGIWIEDEVREVVVSWPPGEALHLRAGLLDRLRAARKRVSAFPAETGARRLQTTENAHARHD